MGTLMPKVKWPDLGGPYPHAVGDIVTRDGSDRHVVLARNDDCITVVCVDAPASGWCDVGDIEFNLCRRYATLVKGRE